MKKFLVFLVFALTLASCSTPSITREPPSNKKLVYKAYSYIDLQERRDRQEIKDLIGVDPVRYEWCAAFVNAILESNDLPTSNTVSKYPLTARSFLNLGEEVEVWNPIEGDIVVFPRGNQGWQGHVGFYVGAAVIDNVDYYYILGGNQNDKVSIEAYPAYKAIGIRRVW